MRHHHEEGRGPRGRHGDPSEHGDHGRRGGGRRQRFFGHGELRLIILDILSRSASHGYELIKEIETLTQGTVSYTHLPLRRYFHQRERFSHRPR